MSTFAQQLAAVLGSVRTPGDFCTAGAIDLALPRLTVQGVGPVALPLLPVQAAQLVAVADRAPYGRGAQTLVDTTVRRTWQIGADRVRTEGEHWARTLQAIVARAAEGLGAATPVVAQLYKLLVYDEGSFFVGHRDTEKAAGMFASLVVALPSIHTGGELVVRHKGREVRLDLAAPDPSMAAYAAFYADCVHEVLPVTSGCRLTLVYNLLRQGAGRLPEPPDHEAETARVAALLADWAAGRPAAGDDDDDEAACKLVYPLEHAYTPAELSFQALKGPDAAAAAVLAAAAQRSGCELHVALLTLVESGSAEHTGYARRRSWRDDDAADDEFEIVEVYDRSATLSDWRCADGSAVDFGVFPFDETELSPPEALQGMKPDEQSFEEATGNEGASFERSYRRARRRSGRGRGGSRSSARRVCGQPAAAGRLARRWRESGAGVDSALWQEAHELAGHMLASWPQADRWARRGDTPSDAAGMLAALTQLKDAERIDAFLAEVAASGVHGKGDNESLLAAAALLDPQRAAALIERIVQANAAGDPGACADLLARAAAAAPAGGSGGACSLVAAARALVESLPGGAAPAPQQPQQQQQRADGRQRPARVDPGLVVDLVTALGRIDAALAGQAVDQLLARPATYGLDAVVLPALRRLSEQAATRDEPGVQRLRAACVQHLRSRTAEPLAPPADWTRAAALDCRCAHCAELAGFLARPDQQAWTLKAAESLRGHVAATVQRCLCDLDLVTERRGRPYSLVCTKNQAGYQRRAKQRREDLEDLARLA